MNKLVEFEFEDGVNHLMGVINNHLDTNDEPMLLAVAGGVGSGKSYLAYRLKSLLNESAALISQDDYFFDNEVVNPDGDKYFNWECPDTLNVDLLNKHLDDLLCGKAVDKPVYCMESSRCTGTTPISPARIVILEGTHVLNSGLINKEKLNVFVVASDDTRLRRKLVRDVIERKKGTEEFVKNYYDRVIRDSHNRFVEPTKKHAHIVVHNES